MVAKCLANVTGKVMYSFIDSFVHSFNKISRAHYKPEQETPQGKGSQLCSLHCRGRADTRNLVFSPVKKTQWGELTVVAARGGWPGKVH